MSTTIASPIVLATWQAGLLSALSNGLAQYIASRRAGTTFVLNAEQMLHFVLFSVLSCPPNFLWQGYLEAQFPAYADPLVPSEKKQLVDEPSAPSSSPAPTKKLNIKNTAIKVGLDQTVGAVVNTALFIAGIALIRGQPWSSIQNDLHDQFLPTMLAGIKLWPAVSLLCFTVVPLEYRMLVGSVAGLFWGIYLSLVAGSKKH